MAITFLKRKKIQKYLVLVFVIIILIVALMTWYGFFKKPKEPTLSPVIHKLLEKIEINFGVLEIGWCEGIPICDKYAEKARCEAQNECRWFIFLREATPFGEIQPFEKIGLPEEKIGRENPFTPY